MPESQSRIPKVVQNAAVGLYTLFSSRRSYTWMQICTYALTLKSLPHAVALADDLNLSLAKFGHLIEFRADLS